MRKNKKRIIPSIISIAVNEPGQSKYIRPGVDIACVIDSGYSMKVINFNNLILIFYKYIFK